MPKPKDSTALYEVIRRGRPEGTSEESGGYDQAPDSAPEAPQPQEAPAASNEGPPEDGPAAPLFAMMGGQVRLALSPVATGVALFGVLLLIVLAYALGMRIGERKGQQAGFVAGQKSVESETWDDIRAARSEAPTEGLFEGVGETPVRSPSTGQKPGDQTPAAAAQQWVPGYTYIVVQDFRAGDEARMRRAQQFLADNGVETVAVPLSDPYVGRLITTRGFNWDDAVQKERAQEYKARIQELGDAYVEAGGAYGLQGYFKKLSGQTW